MKVTVTAGTSVFKIAGRSMVSGGVQWHGRLLNSLVLSRTFSQAGSAPAVLNISVKNNDFFIPKTLNLWAADVLIEADSGLSWSGKVTAYDSDGPGVLYLVATEKAAPELTIQVPDEVARLVTVDENFHVSALNVTLPLVIGGNSSAPILIKGILIDKVNGIHLLCVGEIHQVVKVYRGTEEITEGFSVFTGTSAQADYKGFAYVHITDETLRKNDDGSYASISAEVIGLKLGSHTVEECRNGARFLQYFLTTAKDGIGGWGLGIDSGDLDTTAFSAAISRVDTAGLKLDGIFYFRQQAQSWIDQICQAIRGTYEISASGKRRVFVNATDTSVFAYNPSNMKLLRDGKGAYTGQVFNKGKLDYDYNPLTGQFMNFATYQNSTSIDDIEEQDFYGQSYLIKDATTAQAILEYTCKRSLIGAEKVYFETDTLPSAGIKIGDVITVDYPEKSLSGTWQITGLQIGDFVHTIEAEKFDSSIFSVGAAGTAIDWAQDAPVTPSVVPGVASGLSLSSEVRPSPDGTNIVVIKGTFTPPAGAYIAASIEWGEGILPILSWNSLGMIQGDSFEIAPVKPAQDYAVRIRMVTSTGKSSYITGTITAEGDAVPPGAPSIGVTSYLKTVTIQISLATVPSDLAGFAIFRATTSNSADAVQVGSVSSKDGRATHIEEAPEYGVTYSYWVKSFDTWGNLSAFSDRDFTTISAINSQDLIDGVLNRSELFASGVVDAAAISAEAIKSASGALVSWSPQNCTTASIYETNGVIDTSGRGNHAAAYGGVTVAESEMGRVFRFSGTDGLIVRDAAQFRGSTAFSVSMWIKTAGLAAGMTLNGYISNQYSPTIYGADANMYFSVQYMSSGGVATVIAGDPHDHFDNVWHHYGFVANGLDIRIYRDGVLVAVSPHNGPIHWENWSNSFYVGRNANDAPYFGKFDCFDVKHYNRALTATEIKSLYQNPGDVAFGRVTADLIATNGIIARHITAGEITTAKIAAGAITADKILVASPGSALNDDPGFQDPSAWAFLFGGSYPTILSISDGVVGTGAARSPAGVYSWFNSTKRTPLDKSKSYRLRFWARRSSNANGTLYGVFALYDASGVEITGAGSQWFYSPAGVYANEAWTEYAVIVPTTYPSNAAFMRPGAILNYSGSAGYMEIQDLRIEECLPATLIQNGAITTDKILANAITSGKIAAGEVKTANLDANCVSADKIAANAITASKLNVNAIKKPMGAMGAWTAKGATADSLAMPGGVKDVAGRYLHGTASGGVTVTNGPLGTYFGFNAAKSAINIGNAAFSATAMSFHAQVYIGSVNTTYGVIFARWGIGGDAFWIGTVANNPSQVQVYFNGNLSGQFLDLPLGATITLTITVGGGLVTGYYQGELYFSASGSLPSASGGVTSIGYDINRDSQPFVGYILNPSIYDRVLTPEEVKTLYMLGTDTESGTITADRVATGQVKSLNYSTTAGSMLNLDDGTFAFGGGSSAPKLSWNGTTLAVTGTVNADAGKVGIMNVYTYELTYYSSVIKSGVSVGFVGDGTNRYARIAVVAGTGDVTKVDIAAETYNGYRDGSTTDKALIRATTALSSYYAFYTDSRIYAGGGFYPTSDENAKSDIADVSVLDAVKQIRVKKYRLDEIKIKNLKREKEIERNLKEKNAAISETPSELEPDIENYNPCKSIGVMAQDFNKAFGVGHNESETYNLTDAIGVALRAIQELAEIVDDLKAENKELRAALNLPEKEKPKKENPETVELTDEQKELLYIVEKRARKSILAKLLEAEKK